MATILVSIRNLDLTAGGPLGALHAAGHVLRHVPVGAATSLADLVRALDGCAAVIAGSERYTAEVFAARPELRHIARFGAGYDAIDVAAATAAGVVVSNSPGANATAVADLTLGLILGIARAIPAHDRRVRQGIWQSAVGADVWRQTLGIVGLGRIGQGVARRARGFEMRLLAHEPAPNMAFVAEFGVELVSLYRLFAEADFVTLHAPASDATAGLVNARLLDLMKPTAYLINAARGRLVDEDALYAALAERRIAGAALDVRVKEPPSDTRFSTLDNVILTPHTAAGTPAARVASGQMAAEGVCRVLAGERPEGLVNPEVWARRRSEQLGVGD